VGSRPPGIWPEPLPSVGGHPLGVPIPSPKNIATLADSFTTRFLHQRRLGATFACALLAGIAGARQSPPNVPPPSELLPADGGCLLWRSTDQKLTLSGTIDMSNRRCAVQLIYYVPGQPEVKRVDSQAVRYWPTTATNLGNLKMAICGKAPRTGNTIIEVWTFSQPSYAIVPFQTPNGPNVELRGGKVVSVEEVYNANVAGRLLVEECLPWWGTTSDRLLVKFHDTHDVYGLDCVSGNLNLLASPTSQTGVLHAALLTQDRVGRAGKLAQGGYVYQYAPEDLTDLALNDPAIVVLMDANQDGVIESISTISRQQHVDLGYGSASSWLP